ncbi:hypothetical protein [Inhella proteolytica]|uniref:Uncharacterized protein n=1 Tax=Inhella proteolytica TaxID=2795029 RepID=A0A931IZR2_9BURK|nr:hypothetical protein [Inhella proteolytica]MBH9576801.1 hypothetical protein [Inhella proteolytica]
MESRFEHLVCLTPDEFKRRSELSNFRWKLLAHGDSWFSFAAQRVDAHANLLEELVFSQPTLAVSCAGHHNALRRMVDLEGAPDFVRLLDGEVVWDGVLLSVGGNDLVAAAQVPASLPSGEITPLTLRLLRKQTEWGPPSAGVSRYFSEEGWATYCEYLRANLKHVLSLRDDGPNKGKPIFMHCYAVPTPRPAGAEDASGPWLYPALKAYAIPQADWAAMSRLMLSKLATLLKACAADKDGYPQLHVFDSTQVPIAPAALGSSGISGDWHNEIHLNHSGCFKIARAWSLHIEAVLSGKPLVAAAPTGGRGRRG